MLSILFFPPYKSRYTFLIFYPGNRLVAQYFLNSILHCLALHRIVFFSYVKVFMALTPNLIICRVRTRLSWRWRKSHLPWQWWTTSPTVRPSCATDQAGRDTSVSQKMLRIRDVYPWSGFFYPGFRIQIFFYPGSASKNFSILTQKIVSELSEIWSGLFIPDPDFLPIPDPGSSGRKGTGSRIRIHNTVTRPWSGFLRFCWPDSGLGFWWRKFKKLNGKILISSHCSVFWPSRQ